MGAAPARRPGAADDGIGAMLAETEDCIPTGPLLLPHFAGTGSVLGDENACGALLGLRFETRRGDILRSLLEGITYEQAIGLDTLDAAAVAVCRLRAIGGGARSALWLQIKADILGRTVERALVDDASCLGAAMLAGQAIGVHEFAGERGRPGSLCRTILPEGGAPYRAPTAAGALSRPVSRAAAIRRAVAEELSAPPTNTESCATPPAPDPPRAQKHRPKRKCPGTGTQRESPGYARPTNCR